MASKTEVLKRLRKWFENEMAALYLTQGSLDDIHECANQIDAIDDALSEPASKPAEQEPAMSNYEIIHRFKKITGVELIDQSTEMFVDRDDIIKFARCILGELP